MKALVTGASGFVGRAVVSRLLDSAAEVVVLRRAASRRQTLANDRISAAVFSTTADIPSIVQDIKPDLVVHLTAQHLRDPLGADDAAALIQANVALGAQLLEGFRDSSAVVVNAASYFQFRGGRPAPHSLNAATKQAFLEIAGYHRMLNGLDVRDVVLYDNYGLGDTRNKLVPQLLAALESDEVFVVGPLDQQVNLLHVDDVAVGLIAAATPGAAIMTTVRAANTASVGDIIRIIEGAAGRSLRVRVDETRTLNDLPSIAGDRPTPPAWLTQRSLDQGLSELARLVHGGAELTSVFEHFARLHCWPLDDVEQRVAQLLLW